MNMPLPKEEYFTFADYQKWEDGVRYELIDGVPYMMSPAPSWKHQSISSEFHRQFANFLKGKPCKVLTAPFDVRLNGAGDNDDTVVQPDLLVVCDRSKLDEAGCNGAPDMVIEILSPSTARHDRLIKFQQYRQAGVREYWIVDPDTKSVQACLLENGKYTVTAYGDTDTAPVNVLDGCMINFKDVFAE